ncbi:hypothetical protein C0Z18_20700 [Trinickia dabaoshanensis]|uniref:Glycine zipper domain-containing protein n=1 Tax=Trinickia dabaoshanensis TaxID=564714 RepID=A0A2N7VJ62_9BURK|nr:hypothetical protein [Trinickia dabaoshanensis]PMS17191.1 hypothetical protein C0Z18_20700 [Trinickia dabaoshanensis]
MSLIVAGRFTTFADGEAAANRLFAAGFVQEDVTLFFVNPRGQHARFPIGGDQYADPQAARASKGAGKGGAIGAVIGAVVGVALFSAFSSPFLILVVAAGVGAYIGSLAGAMSHTRGGGKVPEREVPHESRDSGVLVAVHVSPDNQLEAARVLREAGSLEVERAHGRWQHGRWADFDPTKDVEPIQGMSSAEGPAPRAEVRPNR